MNHVQPGALDLVTAVAITERTRRDEARAARREEILAAARTVFAARGFSGTTIADIAEEAGIALGTIYNYFASKDAVFSALNQRFNEMIAGALSSVSDVRSVESAVRRRVDNVFSVCAENRDLVRLVVLNADPESAVTKRARQADEARTGPFAAALTEGMRAGWLRKGDPEIMARLIFGTVSMAVYQAFVLADGKDAAGFRDACADMVLAYMKPDAQ
jgi:AcrR family transcriptional regulator